jgi:hypothetical protein
MSCQRMREIGGFLNMIIWTVKNGQLQKWERLGQCNGCGACCKGWNITYEATVAVRDDDSDDYSGSEGWSAFKHHGVWWWMRVTGIKREETMCECLDGNRCGVWMDEVEFPLLCRYFPVHPDNLKEFPQCGFRFERRS